MKYLLLNFTLHLKKQIRLSGCLIQSSGTGKAIEGACREFYLK